MTIDLVAGWTSAIDFMLIARGALPNGTMFGHTAELILMDDSGNQVTTTGDVEIADPTNWVVRYTPDATDLIPGNYYGRFKITDAAGGVAYFPSGEPDLWIIRRAA